MKTAQDLIVVRSRRTTNPALTLVCLGFCGGGTGQYHQWNSVVPADVDLAAVCYPGREGRFHEGFAQDWERLAADATQAVLAAAAEGPYVLFGHSMGGWMAFDVAVRIERSGGPIPQALVVSSANAPSRGLTFKDMFPAQHDTDEQLLDWMNMHGMMPEHVVSDPDLQELAIELLRADIRVRDAFRYIPNSRVSMPVQVLSGASDTVIEPNAGEQWRDLALGEFRHDVLPGGHFYTPDVWSRLPTHITAFTGTTQRL
ncbi:thioesterase II family protein [Streptomyces shenzhenensis]|uniref:thioesterase II family protein n=1 Tax=Streptomyces shenzhenensis TaxID=943815 RepID=UPI001F1B3D20|nr:alpha/beta fold hydrolase [Streptomyces shenzhenensis]